MNGVHSAGNRTTVETHRGNKVLQLSNSGSDGVARRRKGESRSMEMRIQIKRLAFRPRGPSQ